MNPPKETEENLQSKNPYQPELQPVDRIKQRGPKKLWNWMRANPKKSIMLLLGLLLITAFVTYLLWPRSVSTPDRQPEPTKPAVFYSPLTGKKVTESDSKLPVIAAMIENSPEARPQSGLKQAGVVFESVAEGGITRFLALYQEDKPKAMGPIRSVRPHFASWVAAFDAGLAHVGGSAIPLRKLRSGAIKDLDQFTNAGAYWRSSDRYAPHNVYTNYKQLASVGKSKDYNKSTFTAWPRVKPEDKAKKSDDAANSQQKTPAKPATNITVPVSTGLFAVKFNWKTSSQSYVRSQGGTAHMDREHGRIAPNVVIVLQVPHNAIRESNGYSYPNVNSTGNGWVFQKGTVIPIKWYKGGDKQQIIFKGTAGQSIELTAGRTWVTAIPTGTKPKW